MSEFRIELPKPGASTEEWQQLWDELMAIDSFDPALLSETLEALDRLEDKPRRSESGWP